MTRERIGQEKARKDRGLLEHDYADPCPNCGGVYFDWWETCKNCEQVSNNVDSTLDAFTDGGDA